MIRRLLFAALALCAASPALAQSTYPTAAGGRVAGVVPLQCDANGANCVPAGTAGAPAAGAQQVQGNVAHDGVDSGNPIKAGGYASDGFPASVAAGDRANLWLSRNGAIVTSGIETGLADGTTLTSDVDLNSGVRWRGVVSLVWNGTGYNRPTGDVTGPYSVGITSAAAAAGTTNVVTAAVASSLVGKASAGNLYGLNVTAGASAGYVMVFNATSAPADGAVTPARCIPLAANTGIDLNFRGQPIYLSTGITIVFSTTGCFSKTASATAFIAADVK